MKAIPHVEIARESTMSSFPDIGMYMQLRERTNYYTYVVRPFFYGA